MSIDVTKEHHSHDWQAISTRRQNGGQNLPYLESDEQKKSLPSIKGKYSRKWNPTVVLRDIYFENNPEDPNSPLNRKFVRKTAENESVNVFLMYPKWVSLMAGRQG